MLFIKIKEKQKIIENKLDAFILILCLSPVIPLIFNSYVSLTGTIESIFKYIICFFIYLIVKDITIENKKIQKYIINILIISSVVLVVIGIDKMTTNIFTPFTTAINSTQIEYDEIRMDSLFSYANAFAVFCSMALFLAIGNYIKASKKIEKIIFSVASTILEKGIILSYSRTVLIFLIVVFTIYLILLKKKDLIIETSGVVAITGMISIIYTIIYMKCLNEGNYLTIWILTFVFPIIASIFSVLYSSINNKISKIKTKNIVIILCIIIFLGVLFIAIGLKQKKVLELFNSNNSEKTVTKELYQLEGNKDYNFTFDIKSQAPYDVIEIFTINIIEKNKYFDDIKETSITFGQYEGIKEINIKTDEDTTEIFIEFKTKIANENIKLEIKSLYINGKEEILEYKYLPTNLVNKIKNINLKTKSAWERGVFILDGIKLISQNFLFGIGGDGWYYKQGEVQSYLYWAKEVHSFPVQIFLEFGIIGFISLIGIIFVMMKYSKIYLKKLEELEKEERINYITILISILIIFLHSLLDFDLSFMCILIATFTLLGIISSKLFEKQYKNSKNIINIIIFVGLIPLLLINIYNNFLYNKEIIISKEKNADIIEEEIEELSKYPTYLLEVKEKVIELENEEAIRAGEFLLKYEKKYRQLEICNILINLYSKKEETKASIENICNIAINTKLNNKYNVYENLERQELFLQMGNILYEEGYIELANKMYTQILNEYEESLQNIKDYKKCRIKKEDLEKYENILKENKNQAIKELEK